MCSSAAAVWKHQYLMSCCLILLFTSQKQVAQFIEVQQYRIYMMCYGDNGFWGFTETQSRIPKQVTVGI